jgi:dinuclear metal center YbgI/SA1388 family protein
MTAAPLDAVCQLLAQIAPLRLAEEWDNVGLLVGDRSAAIRRVMTCLTVTPPVVEEALQRRVDLLVTHHPLPFKPLAKITNDSTPGRMLLRLIAGGVALYSAHTAFDSAAGGINALWAQELGLQDVVPLIVGAEAEDQSVGSGRCGHLAAPMDVHALAASAAAIAGVTEVRVVEGGRSDKAGQRTRSGSQVQKVGIACGSGGSFLPAASARGCHALVTGEATFHTCLEAEALGIALILVGHYGSERFAMERLAVLLGEQLRHFGDGIEVCASFADVDPLRTSPVSRAKH